MYQHLVKNPDSAMYYYRKSGRVYTGNKVGSNENPWYALLEVSGAMYNADYFIEAYEVRDKKWKCYQCFDDEEKYKMLKNLRDNPSADAYIKLGDELTKKLQFNEPWKSYMSRFNNGVTIYDKAVKLDPTKKAAVNTKIAAGLKEIAGSYLEDAYYEDALTYYERALKYTQKDPEIYSAIGYIKLEKAKTPDYDAALANYQKALALTTSSMAKKDTYENIGLCYEKKKDYKNAIVWYDKAVATEPNFAKSAHYKLARVYDALGNAEKAKYHRMRS
jgi:tetratricopeptide (TPR) repeat protein